jgi:hypothetical protein
MGSNVSLPTEKDIAQFSVRNISTCPVIGYLAKGMLVLPVSTERGFSWQNFIKTDLKNSLKPESLSNLMTISIEGPPSESFNFDSAFDVWSKMKARRILLCTYCASDLQSHTVITHLKCGL